MENQFRKIYPSPLISCGEKNKKEQFVPRVPGRQTTFNGKKQLQFSEVQLEVLTHVRTMNGALWEHDHGEA